MVICISGAILFFIFDKNQTMYITSYFNFFCFSNPITEGGKFLIFFCMCNNDTFKSYQSYSFEQFLNIFFLSEVDTIYCLVQRFVYTFDALWSQIYFIQIAGTNCIYSLAQ